MRNLARACALVVFSAACSSQSTNPSGSDGGVGAGGDAGITGSGGGGGTGAEDGAPPDGSPGPCGVLMVLSGSVCVDRQPALHADGSQGTAVSWTEAVTICEARGARLCTEAEREAACPDGQVSLNTPANGFYCGGPAATWEWSTSASCVDARCVSPCCNSVAYPCQCSKPASDLQSYRCCKNL